MMEDQQNGSPSDFGGHALNLLGSSLEALAEDPKYSDWLFVFGTVIAFGDRGPTAKKDERYDNWNFAPVYKGGPQGKKWLVTKSYISSIDYIHVKNFSGIPYPPENSSAACGPDYSGVPKEAQEWLAGHGYTVIMDNILVVDEAIFGIEICLDHLCGALKANLAKHNMTGVAVQIVTSAGMEIEQSSIAIAMDGAVYLQDGLNSANSEMIATNVATQYRGYMFPFNCESSNGPDWIEDLNGYYAFNAGMGCANPGVNTLLAQGAYPAMLTSQMENKANYIAGKIGPAGRPIQGVDQPVL